MAPRFSILLPTRNRAALLSLAISSALAQTDSDFELLVVGDGCTDDTAAVVEGFRDSRVRWFDLPKAFGFGYANRNVALRESRGDFIAFLADDDLLCPDHLASLSSALEATGAEWAYSRPLWITADGVVVPFASNLRNADELETFLTVANHIPASCVMYRRQCLDAYGYWPEDVPQGADWHYWIRMIEGGRRTNLTYSPVPTVLHFNAVWKTKASQQLSQVTAARRLAVSASWWPTLLRPVIPAGVSEQQVFRDLIQDIERVHALRRDVSLVVERLAWMQLNETPVMVAALEAELASATSERDAARHHAQLVRAEWQQAHRDLTTAREAAEAALHASARRAEQAEAQIGVVTSSRSWRLTSPLRAIVRAMRGPGSSS